MGTAAKPPKFRLITGNTQTIENAVNELWGDYVLQSLTFTVVRDEIAVTAQLILTSEIRMALLAQGGHPVNRRQ